MTAGLTAIVLTFNEEVHIQRCIESARRVAERVCVVDSFSTDRTVEIASGLGAEVRQHKWKNYADQFQWGLDNFDIATEWVLRLDADEYLDDELTREIETRLTHLPAGVSGVRFCLKVVFKGRWIRWGGYYPTYLLRIWRRQRGRMEQRWMDEHIVLDQGEVATFAGHFVNEELKDFHFWIAKHNGYATRTMLDFINNDYPLFAHDTAIMATGNAQARRKRFLKDRVFHRLPLFVRPFLYFIYRYVFLLGFLDGKYGLIFHFNHALWFRLLESVKIEEARRYIGQHGLKAFKAHIRKDYGLDI